jgi:hypothetical protein
MPQLSLYPNQMRWLQLMPPIKLREALYITIAAYEPPNTIDAKGPAKNDNKRLPAGSRLNRSVSSCVMYQSLPTPVIPVHKNGLQKLAALQVLHTTHSPVSPSHMVLRGVNFCYPMIKY